MQNLLSDSSTADGDKLVRTDNLYGRPIIPPILFAKNLFCRAFIVFFINDGIFNEIGVLFMLGANLCI